MPHYLAFLLGGTRRYPPKTAFKTSNLPTAFIRFIRKYE